MTTPNNQGAAVTQGDREAAADLMDKLFAGVSGMESDLDWSHTVRAGEDDEYPTVQAFARHREEATRQAGGAGAARLEAGADPADCGNVGSVRLSRSLRQHSR